MKNIEQMPNAQDAKNEIQEIREYFFVRAVNESIIDDFVEDLENIISDDEFIKNVLDTINGYTIDEQKQILALPKSIREKRFLFVYNDIYKTSGKHNAEDFVKSLLDDAKQNGFTIGYHVSPRVIVPENNDWYVRGTDMDDRDNMKMAYYSLDYKNLFRKNRGDFLYIIRAEAGKNSSHKKDNSNNWGRANALSIVSAVNLGEIYQKVENMIILENKKELSV